MRVAVTVGQGVVEGRGGGGGGGGGAVDTTLRARRGIDNREKRRTMIRTAGGLSSNCSGTQNVRGKKEV